MPMANPLFKLYIYIINLSLKSCLNAAVCYWWEKLAKIWSDRRNYICFISYYMVVASFQSHVLIVKLFKQWLIVENFVLMVISKY